MTYKFGMNSCFLYVSSHSRDKSTTILKVCMLVNLVMVCHFAIPQGTLPWQTIKVAKSAFFGGPTFIVVLSFRNKFHYHNFNFKRLHCMNLSALCKILVRFGPVTPEFMLLTIATFAAIW